MWATAVQIEEDVTKLRDMAFELVSWADLLCVLDHFQSPTRWNGSRGQVKPNSGPKPAKTKIKITT